MLRPPDEPKEPAKRPGMGFFALLALLLAIVCGIIWAFSSH